MNDIIEKFCERLEKERRAKNKLMWENAELKAKNIRKDDILRWWLEHASEILPKEPDKEKGIPYKEEYQYGVDETVAALSDKEK